MSVNNKHIIRCTWNIQKTQCLTNFYWYSVGIAVYTLTPYTNFTVSSVMQDIVRVKHSFNFLLVSDY